MDTTLLTEKVWDMTGVNPRKCMKCGKCSATCPAYDEMEYHPHQFVSLVERGEAETLMNSRSIYMCLSCMACVERCPRGVEPGKFIEAVRLLCIRQQGGNHLPPDEIPARLEAGIPQQALMSALRKFTK